MPRIQIKTDRDVERALSLATGADRRTIRRWLAGDPNVRPLTDSGLESAAEKLGLGERVRKIRGSNSEH
jgi:hypothetical protein